LFFLNIIVKFVSIWVIRVNNQNVLKANKLQKVNWIILFNKTMQHNRILKLAYS